MTSRETEPGHWFMYLFPFKSEAGNCSVKTANVQD